LDKLYILGNRAPVRDRRDAADDRVDNCLVGPAGVEPSRDSHRDRVRAVRLDMHSAEGRDSAMRSSDLANTKYRSSEWQHRVAAIYHQRGAGVICLALKGKPPPPVWPDVRADPNRCVDVDQCTALLDVQLNENTDSAQGLVVAAKLCSVNTCASHRLIEAHAVDIS